MPLCLDPTGESAVSGGGCSATLARMMDQSGEVIGLRQDGTQFPAEVSISEVEIAGEQVFTLCLRDITDRKRAEAERAKLIEILEATPDFILSASVDGTVFYLNKAARAILGVPPECPLERFQIFQSHPAWANDIIHNEGIPSAIAEGTWIGETALVTPEEVEITLSELIIAHKSGDGAVTMFSSIARDITKQKEIEATVRESERRWRRLLETVQLAVVGLIAGVRLNMPIRFSWSWWDMRFQKFRVRIGLSCLFPPISSAGIRKSWRSCEPQIFILTRRV